MSKCSILAILLLMISCKQKENTQIKQMNVVDTMAIESVKQQESLLNEQLGDTIHMLIPDEKGTYSAFGVIDSMRPRVYVRFDNEDTGNLNAIITPVGGSGNIRFSQILFPDQTADGPFGKDLVLKLKQTGEHTLIIGHSLMAEHPYKGKFKVELQVAEE